MLGRSRTAPSADELTSASAAIEAISLDGIARHRIVLMVLGSALDLVTSGALRPNPAIKILNRSLEENDISAGMEQSYRAMARLVDEEDRILLVDRANAIRPRTLF